MDYTDKSLVGSSILFSSSSIIGKIVKLGGFFDRINGFKPNEWSHIGTIIIQENGKLGLLEALTPVVVASDLEKRIKKCNDKMVLCKLKPSYQEKFQQKEEKLKSCINFFVGQKYNTLGAVLSGIDILPDNSRMSRWLNSFRMSMHCSHLDAEIKRVVGVLPKDTITKELTPQDCYEMEIWSEKRVLKE